MSAQHLPVAVLVTPVWPSPGASGRALRAWDWLQTLGKDHRVHIVVCATGPDTTAHAPLHPAVLAHAFVEVQPGARNRWLRWLGLLLPLSAVGWRAWMADWALPTARGQEALQALLQQLASRAPSRIVVFRLGLHDAAQPLLAAFPQAVQELDMDDRESHTRFSVARGLLRMGRMSESLYCALVGIQYWLVERCTQGRYRHLWLAAPQDLAGMQTPLGHHIGCRPNRFPAPHPARRRHAAALRLLFVGTLDYPPNAEAARWLARQLAPQLHAVLQEAWQLTVVGRNPSRQLQQVLAGAGIQLLENHPRIEQAYADADLVLVPLFSGGGTKLKTLEAFAHGLPVVSTPHGIRGLGAIDGQHCLVAASATGMALAVRELAVDTAWRQRLGTAGQALWREQFQSR